MSTQPTIQTILERIQELHDYVEQWFTALETEIRGLRKEVKTMNRKINQLATDVLDVRGETSDLDKRVAELETDKTQSL